MKAKITKPDGTMIEVEGTPEEVQQLTGAPTFVTIEKPCGLPHYPLFPMTVRHWDRLSEGFSWSLPSGFSFSDKITTDSNKTIM